MNTKILLIGHSGFWNRGCEAIVRGTLSIIKKSIPNAEISLISQTADLDRLIIENENLPVRLMTLSAIHQVKKSSLSWMWLTFKRKVLNGNMSLSDYAAKEIYKQHDIVISIGGDNFSDDYGSPKAYFESLNVARKLGCKVVIWGASIGPFKQDKNIWASYMKNYDLITVREDKSREYLKELGITENVKRVADPAFTLTMDDSVPLVLTKNKEYVGLGVSALIRNYLPGSSYTQLMADFSEFVHNEYGMGIMLVPHVIKEGSANNNDMEACNEIATAISTDIDCKILQPDLNACQMKYSISMCKYFIGARTHSTIASFSTGVPTISIGYSVKAYGINQDLLGSDDYVISYNDLDLENLKSIFENLQLNAVDVSEKLETEMTNAKTQAELAGEYLKEVCQTAQS